MIESLDDDEAAYRLFKYKPIDKYLIESLVKSSLWCANRDTLNDPLDCQVDLLGTMRRARLLATGAQKEILEILLKDNPEKFVEDMQNGLQRVGICSFSRRGNYRTSNVQWAHYADKHRGVRLSYRIPHSFIDDRSHDWDAEKELFGLLPVSYKDDVLTNWWLAKTNLAVFDYIHSLAKCYFTAKSPAWKYEREVRIVKKVHGYLKIPSGYLEEVCFGLSTPAEDIELVKKLASKYCGCKKFYKMVGDEKSDYGITKKSA